MMVEVNYRKTSFAKENMVFLNVPDFELKLFDEIRSSNPTYDFFRKTFKCLFEMVNCICIILPSFSTISSLLFLLYHPRLLPRFVHLKHTILVPEALFLKSRHRAYYIFFLTIRILSAKFSLIMALRKYYESVGASFMKKLSLLTTANQEHLKMPCFLSQTKSTFPQKREKSEKGIESIFKIHESPGVFTKSEVVPLLRS